MTRKTSQKRSHVANPSLPALLRLAPLFSAARNIYGPFPQWLNSGLVSTQCCLWGRDILPVSVIRQHFELNNLEYYKAITPDDPRRTPPIVHVIKVMPGCLLHVSSAPPTLHYAGPKLPNKECCATCVRMLQDF